jgi:hypothetical protein
MTEWHDWLGLAIAIVLGVYWLALVVTDRYPPWTKL